MGRTTLMVGRVDGKTTEIRVVQRRSGDEATALGATAPAFGTGLSVSAVVQETGGSRPKA